MKIKKVSFEDAPKVPFNLDGRILFASPKAELVHLTLKPGEKIDRHVQPFDVIFFIISGAGALETGEETFTGTENNTIFVPAGKPRGWNNTGTTDFKVLVIKDFA
jgi:quercetin dioxygenase-like cupin family protein